MSAIDITIISGLVVSVITSAVAYLKAHSSTKALDLEKQTQDIAQRVLAALNKEK